MAVVFRADPGYRGEGISLGLARGLVAWIDGQNVTQEGMGLGTIACRQGRFTYFASESSSEAPDDTRVRSWYLLDSRIVWQAAGRRSAGLTVILEKAADAYMSLPRLQLPLMRAASVIRKTLRLDAGFARVSPVAVSVFDYEVRGSRVEVACSVTRLSERLSRLYVMNELGAGFFSRAIVRHRLTDPPSGWQRLPFRFPTPALFDPTHRRLFTIDSLAAPPSTPVRLFWGREQFADYCWAGFELELDVRRITGDTLSLTYSVLVEEAPIS